MTEPFSTEDKSVKPNESLKIYHTCEFCKNNPHHFNCPFWRVENYVELKLR